MAAACSTWFSCPKVRLQGISTQNCGRIAEREGSTSGDTVLFHVGASDLAHLRVDFG